MANQAAKQEIENVSTRQYGFRCSVDGDGEIYNSDSEILWRFKTQYRNNYSIFGFKLFRLLPDFILYNTKDQEILTVKCERRYPLPIFRMVEKSLPVCTIRLMSILQNKYSIEFNDGRRLYFHMPMYSVYFRGTSGSGEEILVRLVRHDTWYVEIPLSIDNLHIIAALAFIHREREK
jgi:hypothetical protein